LENALAHHSPHGENLAYPYPHLSPQYGRAKKFDANQPWGDEFVI